MLSSQLKRPAKAREIIMAAVIMVFVFFLSNRHFIAPKQAQVAELTTTLGDLNTSIQQKKVENDALRQVQAAAQQKEQTTTSVPQNLSVDLKQSYKYGDITTFLQAITQPMFRLSVNIDSIKHDAAVTQGGYRETKFTLMASGDYAKVVGFLKKLEEVSQDTHQVGLSTIQILVDKGGENVTLSLAGSFYQLEE